jgi:hypothetical protein
MTVRKLLALLLAPLMLAPGSAYASQQQHIVSPHQIAAAPAGKVAAQDADRAAVHQALRRAEVRDAAAKMGVDIGRLDSVVDTLTGADLERAASTARQVNDQLVGGASTVVISTTTIIIALLIVILIVLIAD